MFDHPKKLKKEQPKWLLFFFNKYFDAQFKNSAFSKHPAWLL
jgi:hypothetical protein